MSAGRCCWLPLLLAPIAAMSSRARVELERWWWAAAAADGCAADSSAPLLLPFKEA